MEKDFPAFIFTPYDESSSNSSSQTNKLDFKYSLNINYNELDKKPECLTHTCFSSDHLRQTTQFLPWSLAHDLNKGVDIYLNLNTKSINSDLPDYYVADCKSTYALFYPNLFVKGTNSAN